MNLSEVNWDFNVAGSWPLLVKVATVVLVCIIVAGLGVYHITIDQLNELEQLEGKEVGLKKEFEDKQRKAVNLPDYREQLKQIETSLGEMIKQMPTKAEVANLLVDISQTGLASGLEIKLFKPTGAIGRDFYSELPIKVRVVGKYEQLGLFISGLASLPRIVTIHDVSISPNKDKSTSLDQDGSLNMDATIKTYNEDVAEVKKKKNRRGK